MDHRVLAGQDQRVQDRSRTGIIIIRHMFPYTHVWPHGNASLASRYAPRHRGSPTEIEKCKTNIRSRCAGPMLASILAVATDRFARTCFQKHENAKQIPGPASQPAVAGALPKKVKMQNKSPGKPAGQMAASIIRH